MTGLLATKPRPADVPALAEAALWQELELTPKPGLVDRLNNGSHRDMDHALFVRSIAAITPWFSRFAELGNAHADKPADALLRIIRPMGNSYDFSARWGWPASRRCMPRRTE